MKTFEEFLQEKLGGTLLPRPPMITERDRQLREVYEAQKEPFEEKIELRDLPPPVNPRQTMEGLMKEYYDAHDIEFTRSAIDGCYDLTGPEGRYILNWDWLATQPKRLLVTITKMRP